MSTPDKFNIDKSSLEPPEKADDSPITLRDFDTNGSTHELKIVADRWQLLEKIGRGGMSVVYKARHSVLGKTAAVKMLLPHLTESDQSLRRFQQEAKAASTLKHRNVIAVYDCGVTPQGEVFIIMDYLEGKSLAEIIAADGTLDPDRACILFNQAAEGLRHAHSRGVIHRDLKPSNLMVVTAEDGSEEVKIVDFGIAKVSDVEGSDGLTKTGDVFGSPPYMSPEQCQGKIPDARTDIYSMGCLMYEALSGQPPLIGINSLDTMHRHISQEPEPLVNGTVKDSTLKRLSEIIQKCLEKDPKNRYQSAEDLANDFISALTSGEEKWRAVSEAAKAVESRKRRHDTVHKFLVRSLSVTLAILIVCAIGIASFTAIVPSLINTQAYDGHALWGNEMPPPRTVPPGDPAKEQEEEQRTLEALQNENETTVLRTLAGARSVALFYESRGRWRDAVTYNIKQAKQAEVQERKENKEPSTSQGIYWGKAARALYYAALSSDTPKILFDEAQEDVKKSIQIILAQGTNYLGESPLPGTREDPYGVRNVMFKDKRISGPLTEPLETQELLYEQQQNFLAAIKKCAQLNFIANFEKSKNKPLSIKSLYRSADVGRLSDPNESMESFGFVTRPALTSVLSVARQNYKQALVEINELPKEKWFADIAKINYGLELLLKREALVSAHEANLEEASKYLSAAVENGTGQLDHQLLCAIQKEYADVLWQKNDFVRAIYERFRLACLLIQSK